jgi:hypothetical protein
MDEKDYDHIENLGKIEAVEEIFADYLEGKIKARDGARLAFRICSGLELNEVYKENISKHHNEGGQS